MGNNNIKKFSSQRKLTSIIKYQNESFEKISKDISLANLTFNNSKASCQIHMDRLKNATLLFYKFILLKNAYKSDNTNLDIIVGLDDLKKQLIQNNRKENYIKDIDEILDLYEPFKINKTINKEKEYQISKIFDLIDLLKNYNDENTFDKYKVEQYLIKFNKTNKIGAEFNIEISSENETVYIYTLYYSWVAKLIKILEEFNSQNREQYYNQDLIDEYIIEMGKLESKKKDIIKQIKVLLDIKNDIKEDHLKDIVDHEIKEELVKNYDKINSKIIKTDKVKKLQDLIEILNIHNHCTKEINNYLNDFYRIYLSNLKAFLESIPKTLKYLKNLDYNKQLNIKILRDFIFFLSHFQFDKELIDNVTDYYEKTFDEFKIPENFKIKGNNLYKKIVIKLENYENYNLNCYPLKNMARTRFLYEGFIKYNLLPEINLFEKYKTVLKNFFRNLFLNEKSCVKKLFVDTFPVLEDNYFINEDLLNYIFDKKISAFNFVNKEFVGMTISSNLDIFIKVNFINNLDEIESEISIFAAFIIILIHELAHFIRIYIFKHLGIKQYEKSFFFEENEEPEIGRFIEKKLFGRVIEKINLIETLYILNIDNYNTNPKEFLNGFINLTKVKSIDKLDDNVKDFLKSVDIILNKELNLNGKNELTIKGSGRCLNIGINNDKCLMRETLLNLHKFMDEKYGK